MNATIQKMLVISASVGVVLFLFFDSGAMAEMVISDEIRGNGTMGGMYWTWIPALFLLGLGTLSVWVIFGQENN